MNENSGLLSSNQQDHHFGSTSSFGDRPSQNHSMQSQSNFQNINASSRKFNENNDNADYGSVGGGDDDDGSYLGNTVTRKRQAQQINLLHGSNRGSKSAGVNNNNSNQLLAEYLNSTNCCSRHFYCPSWATWTLFLIIFFSLCLIGGIVGFAAGPAIVQDVVREMLSLTSPYSLIFDFWLDPDAHGVHTYRKLYLYNITNPYEIALNGSQPNIVQIGPFVYKEVWKKDLDSIRWYVNGTVGYRYKYFMYYQPELSIDEVTGRQLTEDDSFNVTILNGPMRGTLYRVGRLPEVVVHVDKKLNITRQAVCVLLDILLNNTILGPKGVFVQRTPKEIFFGYIDPIWNELHKPLAAFDYNASTYFQAQWNGSAVAPSPYTYRSGMMCPLWQSPYQCNNTGSDITLTISGATDYKLLDSDVEQRAKEANWTNNQHLPRWMQRDLLSPHHSQGDITTWAGQLQGQWWWGPPRDGINAGDEPLPDALTPAHQVPGEKDDTHHLEESRDGFVQQQLQQQEMIVEDEQEQQSPSQSSSSSPLPFDSAACRRQYGTDGTRFTLPIKDDSILQIFSDFMGRTFPFTYTREATYTPPDNAQYKFSPIKTKRFVMNYEHGLAATTINRHCYQMRMDGLINVSQFVFGDGLVSKAGYLDSCVTNTDDMVCVDAEMSSDDNNNNASQGGFTPQALQDDGFCGRVIPFNNTFSKTFEESKDSSKRYSYDDFLKKFILENGESIVGNPRKSQQFRDHYETFAEVLPVTGTTLNAKASGLISMVLGPIFVRGCDDYLSNFTRNMPRSLIPYMRLDRTATVGGAVLNRLEKALTLMDAAYALCGVAIGVGVVGLVCLYLREKRKFCFKSGVCRKKNSDLEDGEVDEGF